MLKGKSFRKPDISVTIQDLLEKANSEGNVGMATFVAFAMAFQVGVPHDGFVIITVVSQRRWRRSLSRSRGGWFSGEAETSMVVRPVVDDKIFGVEREVRLVERVVVAASLGGLWWYRFREDVESLVVMVEAKK
ncbi:hypothetical protein DEO72_LG2g3324 [Vigna unguiculata]|uniref:Uncharacterized protein n=1 Tax=Vigna unguiculata TaxID=3917 RepID=A0A4D6L393_VIGUN|nr:hypothetical protein DEO72_LG2g3324 [Vigna unguiculata]